MEEYLTAYYTYVLRQLKFFFISGVCNFHDLKLNLKYPFVTFEGFLFKLTPFPFVILSNDSALTSKTHYAWSEFAESI